MTELDKVVCLATAEISANTTACTGDRCRFSMSHHRTRMTSASNTLDTAQGKCQSPNIKRPNTRSKADRTIGSLAGSVDRQRIKPSVPTSRRFKAGSRRCPAPFADKASPPGDRDHLDYGCHLNMAVRARQSLASRSRSARERGVTRTTRRHAGHAVEVELAAGR